MDDEGLEETFVVGGGYKYCQFGEGNCFLRVPKNCDWRPVVTGWYAEFATLDQSPDAGVPYGLGRWAFEGSTYDPTSHYRAAKVIEFFDQQNLDVQTLRAINQAQLSFLLSEISRYQWPTSIGLPSSDTERRGGFIVVQTPQASQLVEALRRQDVYVDSRQNNVRLGPAPYVTKGQLAESVQLLHQCVMQLMNTD
jgi:kynureninase